MVSALSTIIALMLLNIYSTNSKFEETIHKISQQSFEQFSSENRTQPLIQLNPAIEQHVKNIMKALQNLCVYFETEVPIKENEIVVFSPQQNGKRTQRIFSQEAKIQEITAFLLENTYNQVIPVTMQTMQQTLQTYLLMHKKNVLMLFQEDLNNQNSMIGFRTLALQEKYQKDFFFCYFKGDYKQIPDFQSLKGNQILVYPMEKVQEMDEEKKGIQVIAIPPPLSYKRISMFLDGMMGVTSNETKHKEAESLEYSDKVYEVRT